METKAFDLKKFQMSLLYSLFLGVLVALFFGLGVAAFYPGPKEPEYPRILEKQTPDSIESAEMKAESIRFDQEQREYQKKQEVYSRNVSIIVLVCAVVTLVVSLSLGERMAFFTDGLMVGGIFTLGYSIIRGFMSSDARYRFVIVAIGLVITLLIGYIKFIRVKKEA